MMSGSEDEFMNSDQEGLNGDERATEESSEDEAEVVFNIKWVLLDVFW